MELKISNSIKEIQLHRQKKYVSNLGVLVSVILAVFASNAFWESKYYLASFLFFFSFSVAIIIYFSYRQGDFRKAGTYLIVVGSFLYGYLLFTGAYKDTGYLWCFAIAPLPYFLLGHHKGLTVSILWVGLSVFILWGPDFDLAKATYLEEIKHRYLISFTLLSFLCYLQELSRHKSDQLILSMTGQINDLARTDELTSILNRRGMKDGLDTKMTDIINSSQPFGLFILDLDKFKQVNDEYGHDIGDQTLVEISQVLQKSLRQSDLVARWGGEEFMMIITQISAQQLVQVAEKVRMSVENHVIRHAEIEFTVTVSIGATMVSEIEAVDKVFKRVDKALYQAKDNGRNQVVIC